MLDYMASDFVRRTGLFATQEATVVKSLVKFVLIRMNFALLIKESMVTRFVKKNGLWIGTETTVV